MSKYYIFILVLILILSSISCGLPVPEYHRKLSEASMYKNPNQNLDSFDHVVIVPIQGCNYCVEATTMFLKRNIANNNILFIVVAKNKSELVNLISPESTERANFLLDDQLLSSKYGLVKLYPVLYSKKQGQYFDTRVEINADNVEIVLGDIN